MRTKTNFTAGYRLIIQTATEPRRTIYRKGACRSVAIGNAEYLSGFVRLIECEPLTTEQWENR